MKPASSPLSFRVKLGLGILLGIAAGVPLVYPLIQSKKAERVNTLRMPLLSVEEVRHRDAATDALIAVVCNRSPDAQLTRLRMVFGEVAPADRADHAIEGRFGEPMPPSSCREVTFALVGAPQNTGQDSPKPTAWSALWDKDVPEQWDAFIPLKTK